MLFRKPIPDVPFPNSNDPQDFFRRFAVADGRRRREVVKNGVVLFAGIGVLVAVLVMARGEQIVGFSSIFHALSGRVSFCERIEQVLSEDQLSSSSIDSRS